MVTQAAGVNALVAAAQYYTALNVFSVFLTKPCREIK